MVQEGQIVLLFDSLLAVFLLYFRTPPNKSTGQANNHSGNDSAAFLGVAQLYRVGSDAANH